MRLSPEPPAGAGSARPGLPRIHIMRGQHFIIMTDDIRLEWEHRASGWSKEWYASMGRKGQVRWAVPANCAAIETAIDGAALTNPQKTAMRKDLRLIAAVLGTNRELVTLDTTARNLFEQLAEEIPELQTIRWINPLTDPLPIQPR
jgi:hypothetical protein